MPAHNEHAAERRRIFATPEYRVARSRCRAIKSGGGYWTAYHDGSRVMATGSTRDKAITECALRVYAIWEG